MGFDFNKLRTDKELETDGTWIPFGNGAEIKLARLGNEKYLRFLDKLQAPYRNALGKVEIDDDVYLDFANKAMSKYIILDWKGFEDNDKDVPYNEETAYKYLEEIPDFYVMIVKLSSNREQFQKKEMEIAEKN